MATLDLTFTGTGAGATARQLIKAVRDATLHLDDNAGQSGSVVVRFDNAPAAGGGAATVQVVSPTGRAGALVRIG